MRWRSWRSLTTKRLLFIEINPSRAMVHSWRITVKNNTRLLASLSSETNASCFQLLPLQQIWLLIDSWERWSIIEVWQNYRYNIRLDPPILLFIIPLLHRIQQLFCLLTLLNPPLTQINGSFANAFIHALYTNVVDDNDFDLRVWICCCCSRQLLLPPPLPGQWMVIDRGSLANLLMRSSLR